MREIRFVSHRMWACILAALVSSAPCAAMAGEEPAALLHKAEVYAFEAKQHGAAGKPFTNTVAKRYARLSEFYRARASQAHPDPLNAGTDRSAVHPVSPNT